MYKTRLCLYPIVLLFLASVAESVAQQVDDRVAIARRHSAAVLRLLAEDDLQAALDELGKAADQSLRLRADGKDGIAAAAGGVYRALMQLSTDEQYELLLRWSLPSSSRQSIRILSTPVPLDAPPKPFARALGERPRNSSFPISHINGIRGLFSTAWMLVQAADDVGRLGRLTGELEQLSADGVANADVLLLVARLASRRGLDASVAQQLEQRAAAMDNGDAASTQVLTEVDEADLVLAAAAAGHEELRSLGEDMFNLMVESTYGRPDTSMRPFLRTAWATVVQLSRGESGPEVLRNNRLKYWVPASGKTASLSAAGAVDAMWLVHEEHILHLAGAQNDLLFCRFPLTGEFDFTCETQEGGQIGTDGGLVYGGLQFEALGSTQRLTVWDADLSHRVEKLCPFVRHEQHPTFNRVSIQSDGGEARFAANLHPMWFDDAPTPSPWIGLRSFGDRRPMFRNLKISGKPTIPREVPLSAGDRLRGWRSGFFGETQPSFVDPNGDAEAGGTGFDWRLEDGVISASKDATESEGSSQSLLQYQRPLLDGESISYEFFYESGEFEVHPALGRLALLVEPTGVRIRWITDGRWEWTGLPVNNTALEPLNRRGPRPLPLKAEDWNSMTIARADGKVTLSLNEVAIYQRAIDFGGDLSFGIYRDPAKAAAKVRNIIMTGDWPKTLPEEFVKNPVAVVDVDMDGAND